MNNNLALCNRCNDLLTHEAVLVDGKLTHPQCFRCYNCKIGLDDRFSFIRKQCTFCARCYRLMYMQRCAACSKPLKADCIYSQDVFWHFKCFRCLSCRSQLIQAFYVLNQKQPYCLACYMKEQSDVKILPDLPSKDVTVESNPNWQNNSSPQPLPSSQQPVKSTPISADRQPSQPQNPSVFGRLFNRWI